MPSTLKITSGAGFAVNHNDSVHIQVLQALTAHLYLNSYGEFKMTEASFATVLLHGRTVSPEDRTEFDAWNINQRRHSASPINLKPI